MYYILSTKGDTYTHIGECNSPTTFKQLAQTYIESHYGTIFASVNIPDNASNVLDTYVKNLTIRSKSFKTHILFLSKIIYIIEINQSASPLTWIFSKCYDHTIKECIRLIDISNQLDVF